MTCIVGLKHAGSVYIGGDSAGVSGLDLTVRADRKVFKNGSFVMGFTSSFRMGQLLAYAFSPPKRYVGQDVFAFMVTDFVTAVRDCFRTGGFLEKEKEAELGGNFLVGFEGRLFQVQRDYQVAESSEDFDACGCGESLALGALSCTQNLKPVDRVKKALAVAEKFSAGVRAPFHFETLGPSRKDAEA